MTFSVTGLSLVIGRLLPEPHAGLLAGLLFGTKAALPKELYDALVTSGTLHIVALSGMNIAILGRMVQNLFVPVAGKKIAGAVTLFLIFWFVAFVGPSPSIVRAAIMGGIAILAGLLGRQYWAIYAWGLAIISMLLLNPTWLSDISFQLSALATLGIIVFGRSGADNSVGAWSTASEVGAHVSASPPSAGYLRVAVVGGKSPTGPAGRSLRVASRENAHLPAQALYVWGIVKDDLHLTLAAQVFTIPLILYHFHRISLISPVSNLAIGWVIAPLTGLGWVAVVAGFLWLPLGQAVAWVTWILLEYLVRTVYMTSMVPFASIAW